MYSTRILRRVPLPSPSAAPLLRPRRPISSATAPSLFAAPLRAPASLRSLRPISLASPTQTLSRGLTFLLLGLAPGSVAFAGPAAPVASPPPPPPPPPAAPAKKESAWRRFFRRVARFVAEDGWALLAAAVLAVGAAGLGLLAPSVLGAITDALTAGQSLWLPLTALALVFVGKFVLDFLSSSLASSASENVANRIRGALFESLLRQDLAFFDAEATGQLVSRLNDDVKEIRDALRNSIRTGLTSLTRVVGGTVALFVVSPPLTMGLFAVGVPMLVLGNWYGARLRRKASEASEAQARASGAAAESLANVRMVRAFTSESLEAAKYNTLLEESSAASLGFGRAINLFQNGVSLSMNLLIGGVLYAGGRLVEAGRLTGGSVAHFLLQAVSLESSFESLSVLTSRLVHASGTSARVMELLDMEPVANRVGGDRWDRVLGDVHFRDVSFAYPTRQEATVLRGIDFHVQPGQTVALVGTSGSGKSTIASLLQRFYEPSAGSIFVDGRDLRNVDIHWLRTHMAVVPQEPVLFATSIEENIRYGKAGATAEEVERAARAAGCEFVFSFPDGMHTVVGERGVSLSGGQRQRLAIARALLRDPSILILDEATSALDAESEAGVQESLRLASRGRTTLIIAHRLSTIRSADRIAVVSHGRVAEFGPHDDLLARGGLYAALVRRQHSVAEATGDAPAIV